MQKRFNRTDKLNGEFQKEIYEIISRRIKNPLITEMFSITRVETARDIGHAKVFVSVYSKDAAKKKRTFDTIVSEAKRIRFELAKTSNIRTVPELHFIADDSMEYGDKMDKLFAKIKESESEKPADTPENGEEEK